YVETMSPIGEMHLHCLAPHFPGDRRFTPQSPLRVRGIPPAGQGETSIPWPLAERSGTRGDNKPVTLHAAIGCATGTPAAPECPSAAGKAPRARPILRLVIAARRGHIHIHVIRA